MALYGLGWGMQVAPSTVLLSESVILENRPLVIVCAFKKKKERVISC
jgi:hypothetical protein